MGVSALVLSTIHILLLFQLWPKLRTSDSRVCLNSSLTHNSVDKEPVSIHLFSQFHWGDSLFVPDGLDELVPLLFWHLYCLSSAFCLSFCGFSCLYALAYSVNVGPGQSDLHKISYNCHISKIWIFPVDSSKHISALLENKPLQAWHAPLLGCHFFYHQLPMASGLLERFKESVDHLPQVTVSLSFLYHFFVPRPEWVASTAAVDHLV